MGVDLFSLKPASFSQGGDIGLYVNDGRKTWPCRHLGESRLYMPRSHIMLYTGRPLSLDTGVDLFSLKSALFSQGGDIGLCVNWLLSNYSLIYRHSLGLY